MGCRTQCTWQQMLLMVSMLVYSSKFSCLS